MSKRYAIALLIFLLTFAAYAQDQYAIDSLKSVLETVQSDQKKAKLLGIIAWSYIHSNPDTALLIAEKEYELSRAISKKDDQFGKAQMAHALLTQGGVFQLTGNYPEALKRFQSSILLAQEINDTSVLCNSYNNLGVLYYSLNNNKQALDYFKKNLELRLALGVHGDLAGAYNNLGGIYYKMKEFSASLEYFQKSLNINKQTGNKQGIATTSNNIGEIYTVKENFTLALNYHRIALELRKESGNQNGIATSLINIGHCYIYLDSLKKADSCLRSGLQIINKLGALDLKEMAYETFIELKQKQNDFESAFKFQTLQIQVRDSLFGIETRNRIQQLETDEQLRQIKEEKRILLLQKQRLDNIQYSGILIFIVLLFTLVAFLGNIALPIRLAEGLIFFSFLIFFEFILIVADPYIDKWSGGAPSIKLLFNAGIAALIFPIHALFESKLKNRLVKKQAERNVL